MEITGIAFGGPMFLHHTQNLFNWPLPPSSISKSRLETVPIVCQKPFDHFGHHGRIVRFVFEPYPVSPVRILVGVSFFENHNRADRVLSLEVGNIHAGNRVGSWEASGGAAGFQGAQYRAAASFAADEALEGIALSHFQQMLPFASFYRPDSYPFSLHIGKPFGEDGFGFERNGNEDLIGDQGSLVIVLLYKCGDEFCPVALGLFQIEGSLAGMHSLPDKEHDSSVPSSSWWIPSTSWSRNRSDTTCCFSRVAATLAESVAVECGLFELEGFGGFFHSFV